MDLKDPNFFRLNYLCLNKVGSVTSQSVIIDKNISKPKRIQRVKSGTTSISKKHPLQNIIKLIIPKVC